MAIYLRYGKAFITYWRISPRGFPSRTVSPKRIHIGTRTTYRIVVHGELSERYAAVFEGMEMEAASGRTTLTGVVKDQPHIFGILDRINGLGLKLLSVESAPVESQECCR
jgi:hypothetical protein